ncbi:MAG: hypothetical protein JW774_10465 [Candidatus Aureabacteria bacterium]|nr:hypothetical protein [Candidatus Auribacterota bacterium]
MKKTLLIMIAIFGFITLSWAAKLTFYDGTILDGKIVKVTEDEVTLQYDFGQIDRQRSQIASITNMDPSEEALFAAIKQNAVPERQEQIVSFNSQPVRQERDTYAVADSQKGLLHSDQADTEEDNLESGDLRKSVMNSLAALKESLKVQYEKEKNELIQSFERERNLLGNKLEELSGNNSRLKEELESEKLKTSALTVRLEEQRNMNNQHQESIVEFKNELAQAHENSLKTEVVFTEKMQAALKNNREAYEKEKRSLIDDYDARNSELEKEWARANKKILELAREKTDLEARLAATEKLSDQTGKALSILEREFDKYKKDMKQNHAELKASAEKEKGALEKLLNSSGESFVRIRDENTALQEKNTQSQEQIESLKTQIESLNDKIEFLENEKRKNQAEILRVYEKIKQTKEENKQEREKLLKSLIQGAMEKKKQAGYSGAAASLQTADDSSLLGRRGMMELFQDDLNAMRSQLEKMKKHVARLNEENAFLKTIAQRKSREMNQLEAELGDARTNIIRLEEEKTNLKIEMDKTVKRIRMEDKLHYERERDQIAKEHDRSVHSLESRIRELEDRISGASASHPEPLQEEEEDVLSFPFLLPERRPEMKVSTKQDVILKRPSQPAPEEITAIQRSSSIKVNVGTVSDIEPDFNRIYIETKEIVREGDMLYFLTDKGEEVPLSVIKVFKDLNGAIAEIRDPQKIQGLKIQATVYAR